MGALESKPGEPPRFAFPKCPTPFESVGNFTCLMPCPAERGYERRPVNGGFRCVYKSDPKYSTSLNSVSAVMFSGTTLADLQTKNVQAHGEFLKERDRFVGELAIVDGTINKTKKLRDAFQKLQDAENVRDKAPEAYQQARSSYYIMKDGEGWIEQEKQRLLKAEVEPQIKQFQQSKATTFRQLETQKRTIDVVNGLKDRVLTLKDTMKYSADTFSKQLNKVQGAINAERRDRVQPTEVSLWDWVDTVLNIAIVSSILYVLYMIAKVYMRRSRAPSSFGSAVQPAPRVGVL